ncbi:MAG TPA: ATP-binding protein [archaeon]|nr:ATP-binding protein [archaeon]
MREYFELRVPANPKMMCLVRKSISQASEMVGFSPREVAVITLAVDEGCTNIIRHSYRESANGEIVIRVRLYPDRIVIMLRDFGGEVDFRKLREGMFKRKEEIEKKGHTRPGGLGMMLIHSAMDKVQYKRCRNSGTVLRLVKYLSGDKEENVTSKGAPRG